ncbi:MAG: Gfo/Idh/MocA family oxidoreductase [Verrucomicrobia bacterium]|nr:Gfo/Idh/MocA family oxidoreductase [Verrucomicrobiota bacterium]
MRRRSFLRNLAWGGGSFLLLQHAPSAWTAQANEKLNIALIGVGGRGNWFVGTIPGLGENLVALCDVDETKNPSAYERLPKARKFYDYRKMLDEMGQEIDAVIVAAPDHIHAPAALRAMKLGKPVYCEKPLTNRVHEARLMRETAARCQVATQMGNQGTASEPFRRAVELIQAGTLGDIREVHAWNDGGGPGPRPLPKGSPPVPAHFQWDLWLGPAAERAYHPDWVKGWHGWREFGTGNLGNWASHTLNLPFMALKLDTLWQKPAANASATPDRAIRVQAEVSETSPDALPRWEIIHYDFPARGPMPPVRVNWYNGSRGGFRQKIEDLMRRKLDWGDAGAKKWADFAGLLVVGSKGMLHTIAHNTSLTLLPEGQVKDADAVPRRLPRSPGHEREWLQACRGGPRAMSNFDYAGPLAEFVLLGNVATLFPEKLDFDPTGCRIVNHEKANLALRRDYRKGWEI